MKRLRTIDSFFKKKDDGDKLESDIPSASNDNAPISTEQPYDSHQTSNIIEPQEKVFDDASLELERDPGKRIQIHEHPINQQDEVRRAYIKAGSYQPKFLEYPRSRFGSQYRQFQYSWFSQFPWLEYSPTTDRVYCFPCFLFGTGPVSRPTLTVDGFNNWKRVNDGKNCIFLSHIGGPSSLHNTCVSRVEELMNPSQHVDKHTAKFNDKVAAVALENAPKNAKYSSPMIQNEVLNILANIVRRKNREEVGDGVFCILVDEAHDIAHREQMAIILRFVDNDDFLRERFLDIVWVEDTTATTLNREIKKVFAFHELPINKLRGQSYDGTSNMRGQWNGLQSLFIKECSSAYYVHCFAHQLQLALVAASKEVAVIWLFFSTLGSIVNVITTSPKRHTQLQVAHTVNIEELVGAGELETGRGANQIGTIHRLGATRWGSHYDSVCDLIHMYDASCTVFENIKNDRSATNSLCGEATGAYNAIRSFEFTFILHLLHEIMGITDILCHELQNKSQDILNAMNLVTTTKDVFQKLRLDGWATFIDKVSLFCKKHDVDMLDMNAQYKVGTGRSCQQTYHITFEHHYHIDIFNNAIDFQLAEINRRFSEEAMELLILRSALEPREAFKAFNIDHICKLAKKFYSMDFTEKELHTLRSTTERAFSAMNLIKTRRRNKMESEFLADSMVVYIEKELAEKID
nr:zinc finger MYM-type protein 1-like [Malus domestica]